METWKKYLFGSAILIFLIYAGWTFYWFTNQTPAPVAVTAEPVERERLDDRTEELIVFEDANKLSNLLTDNLDVTYQYLTFDEDGNTISNNIVVAGKESVLYLDNGGHVEYLAGGKWVGFDPDEDNIYTMVCVDEESYKNEYEYLRDSASFYFDELTITDSIERKGSEVTVTRSCEITDNNIALFSNKWEGIAVGDKFVDVYSFTDDIFRKETFGVITSSGEAKDLGSVTMTLSSGLEPDQGILDAINNEEQRNLVLHADMGTDKEKVVKATTGAGTEFLFALPDGYENVYEDKQCQIQLKHQDMFGDVEAYIYETK